MFLYELALELGEHSSVLAARAREAGIEGAGPSTTLSAAQVATLRGAPPVPEGNAASHGPSWIPAPAPPVGPPTGGAPPQVGSTPPPPGFPPQDAGHRRNQLILGAVILAVVVAAVVMFFFATPDTAARRRELAAQNERVDAQTKIEAKAYEAKVQQRLEEQARLVEAEEAREAERQREREALAATRAPAPPVADREVLDRAEFCQGSLELAGFELRMGADALEQKWDALPQTVAENEAKWRSGADRIVASTTGSLQQDVSLYRSSYLALMDGIRTASSAAEVQQAFLDLPYIEVAEAATRFNEAVFDTCR